MRVSEMRCVKPYNLISSLGPVRISESERDEMCEALELDFLFRSCENLIFFFVIESPRLLFLLCCCPGTVCSTTGPLVVVRDYQELFGLYRKLSETYQLLPEPIGSCRDLLGVVGTCWELPGRTCCCLGEVCGGFNLRAAWTVVVLSLYAGRMEAAVSLPQEARQLRRQFCNNTCAPVEPFVRHQVERWWGRDKNITAKLLKLLYADCMVTGCDGSVLLDGPHTEKKAPQNAGLDGFVLIDKIKKVLEDPCPKTVSCADILYSRCSRCSSLGRCPSYPVLLGRRDGMDSKASSVDLPLPSISSTQGLAYFQSKGFDSQDYATLLGQNL
ncbi:Probable peroxidase 26 [Striga hermonthica]|uniref:Peroxidase n=1 Tax=Striga hermonthica TaxID=68872 RepID=A0A9N7NTC9_STRHE|nr:Probable peroxidase 26 [Striga hermonthica]